MSKKLLQIVWIAAIVLYAVTQVSRLQAQIDHAAIKTLALEAIKKQYVGEKFEYK